MKKRIFIYLTAILLFISNSCFAKTFHNNTPSSIPTGPHLVASGEYRLPAAIDAQILNDRMTEVWAKIFFPKDIANIPGKVPIVIMLHGNHPTCGRGVNPRIDDNCLYTDAGVCPSGYVTVPNHEGYSYLANNLASWGMWVVSINANRGITCGGGVAQDFGLNLARGKLVLKHLSLLYQWSTNGGAPQSIGLGPEGLKNKIDFSAVGLFGHSRGGEGVRAAYNLYLDKDSVWSKKIPGLNIKGIYEIGAVDGQTYRTLDANGTVWNQLLPMCDGDVSDLEGRFPFERMLLNSTEPSYAQLSLYEVWGANHNYFNTEWQESDSPGCQAGNPIFKPRGESGSTDQQQIALASVPAFFRSHLGVHPDLNFNQNFNPLDSLPQIVSQITQIDRDFTPSSGATETLIFEDFDKETGINSSGQKNLAQQIKINHKELDDFQRGAEISWTSPSSNTFFEAIWDEPAKGRDIHTFATLDFRVARKRDVLNSSVSTRFGIQLEDASHVFSNEVDVANYSTINGPGNRNIILKTIRIPLVAFKGIDLTQIHGIKFIFDKTETGALYFANIRIQRQFGLGEDNSSSLLAKLYHFTPVVPSKEISQPIKPIYVPRKLNAIKSIRVIPHSFALSGKSAVEISLGSQVYFPAMNSLPILKIGTKKFMLSHYASSADLKELVFTLSASDYQSLSPNDEVTIINGKIWQFGKLTSGLK